MSDRFARIKRFFSGTADVLGTPSGDTRGHVRVYSRDNTVSRGRNF